MSGLIRLFISFALLLAAAGGIYFLWTGTAPPYFLESSASLGILMLVTLLITVVTKPAGEKH